MLKSILAFFMLSLALNVDSAKILGIFHFHSKSHHILGNALLKTLAERGHEVTMLSPYPSKNPIKNYKDIELTGIHSPNESVSKMLMTMEHMNSMQRISLINEYTDHVNEIVLSHKNVQGLLNSGQKFDLVILNWFFNTAYIGFAHHFNAPVVLFSTFGEITELNRITSNPAPYAYIPYLFSTFPMEMSYWQRVGNTIINLFCEYREHFFNFPVQEKLLAKYFPNQPPLRDLLDNISLVLLNSHYSIENPRPYMPMMIPVGGFHLKDTEEMEPELKKYLDAANGGVVYFSLGSNLRIDSLPKEKLAAITKSLSRLPVKVLWKFDGKDLSGIPPNVKISDWFPQTAILSHPNTKLFITHGGLLSTTEAVFHGVPMLGIPFFADQHKNIAFSVSSGYCLSLSFPDLTEEDLTETINELLHNPRYRENIRMRSQALRDQPLKPMDNAIFWIEHTLRQKGAPLLKSIAMKMPWYQYYLVDVYALFIGIVVAALIIFYVLVKILITTIKKLFKQNNTKVSKSKKNKKD